MIPWADDPYWPVPLEHPALSLSAIHLWRANLDQPTEWLQHVLPLLSADERTRAQRLLKQRDQQHFIAGRAILRLLLARYLTLGAEQVCFVYGPYGKPELAAPLNSSQMRFSVSHSGGVALYAFTYSRSIGVDIEQIRSMDSMMSIAQRFFAPAEAERLEQLTSEAQEQAFFGMWTCKEACLKAWGKGLAQALDEAEIVYLPGQAPRLYAVAGDVEAAADWSLWSVQPRPGYQAALAIEGDCSDLRCFTFSNVTQSQR